MTPASGALSGYRPDIDGLRAVAIVLVVLFHAFPAIFPGGFIGVDVFFVISGYLITGIIVRGLGRGRFDFGHFYAQRARRLLPALSLVLLACLAAGWVWLWPAEYAHLAAHVMAGAGFYSNFLLWSEVGYFDASAVLKPLLHLWSLGVEEQFYLLFPLLLWLGWRRRGRVIDVLAAVFGLSLVASWLQLVYDPAGAFYLPWSRLWQLAMGGLLVWWQQTRAAQAKSFHSPPRIANGLALVGLAAIICGLFVLSPNVAYPGVAALLPTGGGLLVIAAGPGAAINRRLLGNKLMIGLGLISYALYLWHWPILSFMHILNADVPPASHRIAAVVVATGLAWLTWRLVENPVRFGRHRRTALVGCVIAIGVVAAIAVWIRVANGVPQRVPANARIETTANYDYHDAYRQGTCFLRPEQGAQAFAGCPDHWRSAGRPTWLLWGDSHAAHLYAGLKARYGHAVNIVQRTASGCPPLANEHYPNRPHCAAIKSRVWQEIAAHRPERVILSARWNLYDWRTIRHTIQRLQQLGIRHIVVVGPVPQWRNGLPRQAAIAARTNGFVIPTRLRDGLIGAQHVLGRRLSDIAGHMGVGYIAPLRVMCNDRGCLVHPPGKPRHLTAWDAAHLTAVGSRWLVRHWHMPDCRLEVCRSRKQLE